MKNETQLETEIRNTTDSDKLKKIHGLVKGGFENQPNSVFWKEAFEMIDNKAK